MKKALQNILDTAQALVESEDDGAYFLVRHCSMAELKEMLIKSKKIYHDVIIDAITIKKITNKQNNSKK